jgi:hypothetical protein
MQRGEVLSTHEVKYMGRWDSTIAPSGRSSLMKYLNKTSKGKMLYYCCPNDLRTRNKSELGIPYLKTTLLIARSVPLYSLKALVLL